MNDNSDDDRNDHGVKPRDNAIDVKFGPFRDMSQCEVTQYCIKIMRRYMGEDMLFITITLPPTLYKYPAITQYLMTENYLLSYFKKTSVYWGFCPELTKQGNVHYHAIAVFGHALHKHAFIQLIKKSKNFGFIKITEAPINHIDNLTRSCVYLLKDFDITKRVLVQANYKPDILRLDFD